MNQSFYKALSCALAFLAFSMLAAPSAVAHIGNRGETTLIHENTLAPGVAVSALDGAPAAPQEQATEAVIETVKSNPPSNMAKAVFAVLRYDGSKLELEEVAPIVDAIIEAAEKANIDPATALTVVFLESRFKPSMGDGGNACGIAQQHARFSVDWNLGGALDQFPDIHDPKWLRKAQVEYECEMLIKDTDYAINVLIHHLSYLQKRFGPIRKSVWMYNGKASYGEKLAHWRATLELTLQRIEEASRPPQDAS